MGRRRGPAAAPVQAVLYPVPVPLLSFPFPSLALPLPLPPSAQPRPALGPVPAWRAQHVTGGARPLPAGRLALHVTLLACHVTRKGGVPRGTKRFATQGPAPACRHFPPPAQQRASWRSPRSSRCPPRRRAAAGAMAVMKLRRAEPRRGPPNRAHPRPGRRAPRSPRATRKRKVMGWEAAAGAGGRAGGLGDRQARRPMGGAGGRCRPMSGGGAGPL